LLLLLGPILDFFQDFVFRSLLDGGGGNWFLGFFLLIIGSMRARL
jgi:hypothetical protein